MEKKNLPLFLAVALAGFIGLLTVIGFLLLQVIDKEPDLGDLVPPSLSGKCGIQECHGLSVTCGSNIPDACTEIYQLGDKCRKYLSCQKTSTGCQLVEAPGFEDCRSCVEKCQLLNGDPQVPFDCESQCE